MKRARTQAREVALKILYQIDLRGDLESEQLESQLTRDLPDPETVRFARALVEGTRAEVEALDAAIVAVAQNWTLERMAVIDRNVLRLGAYQLLHMAQAIPPAVVIDEAVSLAKNFSTKDSGSFVNGILDQIHRRRGQPAADASAGQQDAS